MRVDSRVSVVSGALWLPEGRSTVEDALLDGVLADGRSVPAGTDSVPECHGETPEHMAAEAVRRALARAGRPVEAVDMLAFAWTARFAGELYSPPFRLAKALAVGDCATVGIVQACNGGTTAVEVAVTRMLAEDSVRLAVAVSSDSFEPFGSVRWTDPALMVVGDGAAAAVLGRGQGRFALRSLATRGHTCAGMLEAGQDIRTWLPDAGEDAGRSSARLLTEAAHSVEQSRRCTHEAVDQALDDAGLRADDPGIVAVLLPRLADPFIESFVRSALPEPLRAFARVPDAYTGHLGSGDTLANLEYAQRCVTLAPGEHLLVVNSGQGVMSSCLVLASGVG
ncbi:ketoacyl-ACP synthase III family protein [Streptomyces sp. I05A-00742]|uniref:ketoacyl-ACP synthase III family protein n=1 Tax=Streptomyces sp. I05A-00742 TaxID=2732853 RepID=UPI001489D067|nr:ketoacyl-ACP synthase III family protein [Streptomyces sp. I05A-00742]